jgi:hypothetical protein
MRDDCLGGIAKIDRPPRRTLRVVLIFRIRFDMEHLEPISGVMRSSATMDRDRHRTRSPERMPLASDSVWTV